MTDRPSWIYRQSAVIPLVREDNAVLVVLITSMKGKRWVIPKGIVEADLSPAESAAKEAIEEAGVRGRVVEPSVGAYQYDKWGGTCTVTVFVMEVEELLDVWDEMDFRRRETVSVEEAANRVNEEDLKEIIRNLHLVAG